MAAGAGQAVATLRAGIANSPTVAQSLKTIDETTMMLVRADVAKQDYTAALSLALPLANQGNAEAQYQVGMLYLNGQGTNQDAALGHSWLQKAADNGSLEAKIMLTTHQGP